MTVMGGKILDTEIVFQATRAAVLAGHEVGVQRLGMVGLGSGYGGLDIYAAARALVHAIDEALDDIAGPTAKMETDRCRGPKLICDRLA